MTEYRTILFATDLSERAHLAFPLVRALAGKARLVVLHVVEQPLFAAPAGSVREQGGIPAFWPADSPAHHHELERQLREHYAAAERADIEYRVEGGDAAPVIVRTAGAVAADLIALGTHGRRGLERFLTGSVAETVLRQAHCAVLIHHLPDREELLIRPEPIRLVVHPTDFSAQSKAAYDVACALSHALGARLRLFHVAPDGSNVSAENRHALDALREQAESAGLGGCVETGIAHGEPVAEIVRETGADPGHLVVLGTHGRGGLDRILMGSTAQSVLRDAGCPTVVVKPAADAS